MGRGLQEAYEMYKKRVKNCEDFKLCAQFVCINSLYFICIHIT